METMEIAMKRLQGFIYHQYWSPIWNKLRKREEQIQVFKQQLFAFKFNSPPPPIDKLSGTEKSSVLAKYTKANLKLTIPLDLPQLTHIVQYFIFCTTNQVQVSFKDYKLLYQTVREFGSSDKRKEMKPDLQEYVEVKMKHQNAFACFLYYLEKKYQSKVALIGFCEVINQLVR